MYGKEKFKNFPNKSKDINLTLSILCHPCTSFKTILKLKINIYGDITIEIEMLHLSARIVRFKTTN